MVAVTSPRVVLVADAHLGNASEVREAAFHAFLSAVPDLGDELLINGDVWEKLPADQREIIQSAAWEATFRSQTISNKLNADALVELKQKHGVKIERTPKDILIKVLESWDQIAKQEAAKNAFFRKVYESQRAYASKVVPAKRYMFPPYSFAANYYWPQEGTKRANSKGKSN